MAPFSCLDSPKLLRLLPVEILWTGGGGTASGLPVSLGVAAVNVEIANLGGRR